MITVTIARDIHGDRFSIQNIYGNYIIRNKDARIDAMIVGPISDENLEDFLGRYYGHHLLKSYRAATEGMYQTPPE